MTIKSSREKFMQGRIATPFETRPRKVTKPMSVILLTATLPDPPTNSSPGFQLPPQASRGGNLPHGSTTWGKSLSSRSGAAVVGNEVKSRRDYSRLIRLVVVESRVPAANWILVSETAGPPKGETLILHHAGYLVPWSMNRVGFQSGCSDAGRCT